MLLKRLFVLLMFIGSSAVYGQEIKVMTYNIKYDNVNDTINNWNDRKEKLVDLIKHYAPSFIGMQEALHRQVTYIDSSLTDFAYIGVGREDGKQKGEYSPIHYDSTRYKVLEHHTFWLSDTPDKVSVGWDAALERICTYGLFENRQSGEKLWVFNTHFDHKGETAREKSAELIVNKIKEINTDNLPVVLTGDFNLTPDEKPIHLIKKYMQDGQEITSSPFYGTSGTFNGFEPDRILDHRIDYIFVKNLKVENYTHIDDRLENLKYISDHFPVLATVIK
ncbi:Metal-dependent hydrolase, endonuclease/exonuclease/phosphatase family [Pricia antarctica]|uniref:Metal-dependent hydrolase, endonuclease/exonuclease/phosphatase family n=1 Tax=Pricia antarctica TaxID=641691 RepID=A0A1G7FQV1_9FLAO|nr:endonuclease/exonuclease/phosphatase family protein [Pricia antarctica]SDE78212.1 Metal-dependent hydrolase, endonuclease/exonuclease/phosphatase family [Pricia antarctica]